jgi:hypothetical protein
VDKKVIRAEMVTLLGQVCAEMVTLLGQVCAEMVTPPFSQTVAAEKVRAPFFTPL